MRVLAALALAVGGAGAFVWYAISANEERQRLDLLTVERDAEAEANRLRYLEFERQQRAIPVYRPTSKPGAGQRDA